MALAPVKSRSLRLPLATQERELKKHKRRSSEIKRFAKA
jgi:hypothetical protein